MKKMGEEFFGELEEKRVLVEREWEAKNGEAWSCWEESRTQG